MFAACTLTSLTAFASPSITAYEVTDDEIVVDGRLVEQSWQAAEVSKGMVERSPVPGRTAPVDTQFSVLYDDENLYLGIRCGYPNGAKPRSFELRRDTFNIFSDDTLSIKIDVHRDQVTTLGFVFNAAGAQTDYIALTTDGSFRREFDALWVAESIIADDAWHAEVKIPFLALSLPGFDGQRLLGLNITLDHNGFMSTYDWSEMPPELGPIAATHYGAVKSVRSNKNYGAASRWIPYALFNQVDQKGGDGVDEPMKFGLDARARLSEQLWFEATVLTDFAEVDLDDALVNLTRFPLFLPEKRPFFLSGIDIFSFGESESYQLLYTRRIGLDGNGDPLPILGGAKVHGRLGRLGLGVMTLTTEETTSSPQRQYSVLRLRNDLSGLGHLGLLVVRRDPYEGDVSEPVHTGLGIDGSYRWLDNRLRLNGFGAVTINEGQPEVSNGCSRELQSLGRTFSGGGEGTLRGNLQYVGREWSFGTSVRRVGCAFDPVVGFASRTNFRELTGDVGYIWRREGLLTSLSLQQETALYQDDVNAQYLGAETMSTMRINLANRIYVRGSVGYAEDKVQQSFTLLDNWNIEPGLYTGMKGRIGFSSTERRNPYGSLTYLFDDAFFGGQAQTLNFQLGSAFGAHLRLSAGGSHSWIRLDGEQLETSALNTQLNIALSTQLFSDVSYRVNQSQNDARILARLRWRYLPGSDLFVVYQERMTAERMRWFVPVDDAETTERRITLKLTYWYDIELPAL